VLLFAASFLLLYLAAVSYPLQVLKPSKRNRKHLLL
jgi:hypothetical protein